MTWRYKHMRDKLWSIKINFTMFFIRLNDILTFYIQNPGLGAELAVDNALATMLWEQYDSIMVITTKESKTSHLGSEYYIMYTETSDDVNQIKEIN